MKRSRQALRTIRFGDEPLPEWTQLLDMAASLCPVPEATKRWFSLFTSRTGVDDARTITEHCRILRSALERHREVVLVGLKPGSADSAPQTIHAAWLYALDTMLLESAHAETCAWHVQGTEDDGTAGFGEGDVTLRRV